MSEHLRAGSVVAVPCRHCGVLSLKLLIQAGTSTQRCPRCQKETRFLVKSSGMDYRVWSEATLDTKAPAN